VDGPTSLLVEINAAAPELRRLVGEEVGAPLAEPCFIDALPGYFVPDEVNQARIAELMGKLRAISRLQSVS